MSFAKTKVYCRIGILGNDARSQLAPQQQLLKHSHFRTFKAHRIEIEKKPPSLTIMSSPHVSRLSSIVLTMFRSLNANKFKKTRVSRQPNHSAQNRALPTCYRCPTFPYLFQGAPKCIRCFFMAAGVYGRDDKMLGKSEGKPGDTRRKYKEMK